ncbi:hypothetical protein H6776_01005 [Candidatus Nomurabacteria bacterium]|nr:hypothetical protein [Candidatus Nomurabacteria bacterium]
MKKAILGLSFTTLALIIILFAIYFVRERFSIATEGSLYNQEIPVLPDASDLETQSGDENLENEAVEEITENFRIDILNMLNLSQACIDNEVNFNLNTTQVEYTGENSEAISVAQEYPLGEGKEPRAYQARIIVESGDVASCVQEFDIQ